MDRLQKITTCLDKPYPLALIMRLSKMDADYQELFHIALLSHNPSAHNSLFMPALEAMEKRHNWLRSPNPSCPCGEMLITDCAGECGKEPIA